MLRFRAAKVALYQAANPFSVLDIDRLIEAEFLGRGGADFWIFDVLFAENIARQKFYQSGDNHRQHEQDGDEL